MKTKSAWLALAAVGVSALMASCGGSSDSNDNSGSSGKSTSGGKAGASAGGTSSSGNSSSAGTTSKSGGASSGNASTAGSVSTGGRNNTGGFNFGGFSVGGAFDPSDFACNPVPKVGSDCPANTQPCVDGTNVCYCNGTKWACQNALGGGAGGDGSGQIDCPAAQPMSGDDCGDMQRICPYGNGGCACYMGKWACL